ncbi:hypothetical protein NDU88_002692 [Pleurodeles waltl]|uniref:Uncharacterized protein n=1 Tax=Pleurodeles waltl TaxID=8319 RepID=A0AAV7Q7V5_PLEWA|nr:hypothetical protein NDU88_002692 [Pleurodeles waltl]
MRSNRPFMFHVTAVKATIARLVWSRISGNEVLWDADGLSQSLVSLGVGLSLSGPSVAPRGQQYTKHMDSGLPTPPQLRYWRNVQPEPVDDSQLVAQARAHSLPSPPPVPDISYHLGASRWHSVPPQYTFISAEPRRGLTRPIWLPCHSGNTCPFSNLAGLAGSAAVRPDQERSHLVCCDLDPNAAVSLMNANASRAHVTVSGAWQDGRRDALRVSSSVPADPALILLCSGDLEPPVGTVWCREDSGSCLATFGASPTRIPYLLWACAGTRGYRLDGAREDLHHAPPLGDFFGPFMGSTADRRAPRMVIGGPASVSRRLGACHFPLPAGCGLRAAACHLWASCGAGKVPATWGLNPAGARISAGWAQFWKCREGAGLAVLEHDLGTSAGGLDCGPGGESRSVLLVSWLEGCTFSPVCGTHWSVG